MQFESRMTWEKLSLELDLVSTEAPNSLLPLIIGINSFLWPEENDDWCSRKSNFMSYELNVKCDGLEETDRLNILNEYFFDQKKIQIYPLKPQSQDHLLVKPILQNGNGSALPVSLLYLHLAQQLDLPVYLINLPSMHILKWVRSGKSDYIDLSQAGRILNDDEVLQILNKQCKIDGDSCLDILPPKSIIKTYAEDLKKVFKASYQKHQVLSALNILLKIDCNNINLLAERALLLKEFGQNREALSDLKRYFSFTDKSHASGDLLMALHELEPQNSVVTQSNPDLLH